MKFGISNSIKSRVVRECTPALLNEALDSPIVARVCAEIVDALEARQRGELTKTEFENKKAALKKRLPILTPHATFPGGRRVNADAVASGLSMFDIDHIPDPRGRWAEIEPRKEELGILFAHVTPSTEGLRLFFLIPQGMDLPQAQAWMARQLGDEAYDACTKDLARSSFVVPRGYVLYQGEGLFQTHPQTPPSMEGSLNTFDSEKQEDTMQAAHPEDTEGPVNVSRRGAPCGYPMKTCHINHRAPTRDAPTVGGNKESASSASSASEKLEYHGLPASEIVSKYWELTGDGQPPTQGDRNTKIFDLACSLRHIFNFDRELLNRFIPNYDGFPQEEKMQCIDNALREPRKYMPMKLKNVLKALREEHAENLNLSLAIDEMEQETAIQYAHRLPKRIGLGVDAALKWLPRELHIPALVAMAPALGTLLTRVRLLVHGEWNTLNLQSFIVGEAGSGKSKFARIDAALMKEFYAESLANQKQNEQHRREKERKRNAKEVPVFDLLPERSIPARHSVAQVLDMLNANSGLHSYTFAEEADIMTGNGRQAFADTSAIRRIAFDAGLYAQAYKSESASRLTIEHVRWNFTQCGTPDALYRAYPNMTDGELSRIAIAQMPDNTFAPLNVGRTFGERESIPLELLGHLLSLMQGDVKLAKLEAHATEKIEEFRQECLKNFDKVAARTRMRIPVMVMRMVCALSACALTANLVEKIDRAKTKPTWADGAQTAEEYLKSHPDAAPKHLTKMQNKDMMLLYDVLAEYLTHTQLHYFRERIEQAYTSVSYQPGKRVKQGKNDTVFEKLGKKFTLADAAQAKGHTKADGNIRAMVHQWVKAELVRNTGNGEYEKC